MDPSWSTNFQTFTDMINSQSSQLSNTLIVWRMPSSTTFLLYIVVRRMFFAHPHSLTPQSLFSYSYLPPLCPYQPSMDGPPPPNGDPTTDAPPPTKARTINVSPPPQLTYIYPYPYMYGYKWCSPFVPSPVWCSSPI